MKYKSITKEQSFYLGIAMWGVLYCFPEIDRKSRLPKVIWNAIKDLYFKCPCCAVYYDKKTSLCNGCPIENHCIHDWSEAYYKIWGDTDSVKIRKEYAKKILDKILDSRPKNSP